GGGVRRSAFGGWKLRLAFGECGLRLAFAGSGRCFGVDGARPGEARRFFAVRAFYAVGGVYAVGRFYAFCGFFAVGAFGLCFVVGGSAAVALDRLAFGRSALVVAAARALSVHAGLASGAGLSVHAGATLHLRRGMHFFALCRDAVRGASDGGGFPGGPGFPG